MKTDELISLLATSAGAVEPHAAARRYAIALGCGVLGAALLMAMLLGVRHDLAKAVLQPMFWVKVAFVAGLVAASLFAVLRLSRPGARLSGLPGALAAPVLAMWVLAAAELITCGTGAAGRVVLWRDLELVPFPHRDAFRARIRGRRLGDEGTGADALAPCRRCGGICFGRHRHARLLRALPGDGCAIPRVLVRARHADPHRCRRTARKPAAALVIPRRGRGETFNNTNKNNAL